MLVPKLRFKEFNDEWQLKKLGRLVDIKRGASPRPINKYITSNDNGVNWIKIGDVSTDDMYINSTKEKITIEGAKKSRAVHKGDLILSNSMSFGRPYILNIDGYIHDGWLLISNYSSYFYINFLVELLSSQYMKSQYIKLSAGSTVLNLNSDLVASTLVPVPSLEEQTKIANFLSLIDRKIELQEKLVENLKLYKKGLLKKVFSNNLGWKSAKLGNIFQYEQPNNYIVENAEYNSNYTIPVLTANKGFILGYTNETNTYNKGKCIIFDDFTMDFKYVDFPFKVKSSAIKILTTKKEYNINFMYQLLKTITLEPISHQRHYISMVQNIEVTIPSIEEQNRIANLFTSLDKKIELETKKLQDLKTYKKGLLQKMFI